VRSDGSVKDRHSKKIGILECWNTGMLFSCMVMGWNHGPVDDLAPAHDNLNGQSLFHGFPLFHISIIPIFKSMLQSLHKPQSQVDYSQVSAI